MGAKWIEPKHVTLRGNPFHYANFANHLIIMIIISYILTDLTLSVVFHSPGLEKKMALFTWGSQIVRQNVMLRALSE